jgi:hypothetical protein
MNTTISALNPTRDDIRNALRNTSVMMTSHNISDTITIEPGIINYFMICTYNIRNIESIMYEYKGTLYEITGEFIEMYHNIIDNTNDNGTYARRYYRVPLLFAKECFTVLDEELLLNVQYINNDFNSDTLYVDYVFGDNAEDVMDRISNNKIIRTYHKCDIIREETVHYISCDIDNSMKIAYILINIDNITNFTLTLYDNDRELMSFNNDQLSYATRHDLQIHDKTFALPFTTSNITDYTNEGILFNDISACIETDSYTDVTMYIVTNKLVM